MLPVQTLLWWRLLILAWLTIWITTLPLFHFHVPDTTDRWSALQSRGAHTIFTPDLPGEFSHPFHDSQQGHSSHLSNRAVNSPEIGIAIFDEPDDRKVKVLQVLGTPFRFPDTSLQFMGVSGSPEKCHQLHLLQAFPGSRAPPRIV
jgi:hypothetical protein